MPSAKPSSTSAAPADAALDAEADFLESLVESSARIAAPRTEDAILDQACHEAGRLLCARVTCVPPGRAAVGGATAVPIRMRDEELGMLVLERETPLARWEVVRAAVIADLAARAVENARLLMDAKARETERSLLSERVVTAEQDERRRLALFLHDGAVQSLSGIALMLEAVSHSIEAGRLDEASSVLASALDRHRETIRSLRDLSFNLEPVVLRDQGFVPAVQALTEQVGISHGIHIELDAEAAEQLAEKVQVALYQIIRETLELTIRRGPPSRISISVEDEPDGAVVVVVADDGAGERRRASFDAIAERARTINGRLLVDAGDDGGTVIRIALPPYVARRGR